MYNSLMEISKELNTQNNRWTAMPYFFQIQTREKIAVPEGNGIMCYFYDGTEIETDEEINEAIAEYKEVPVSDVCNLDELTKEEILREAGWDKAYYDYENKYQNSFLTEKACKEHIKANNYHYKKPVDYLSHAFRNPELELILKFLCELTNGKLHK